MSRTSPGAGRPPQIALAALGDTSTLIEAASDYRRRRALLVEALNGIDGIDCPLPDGGMFAFPDVSGLLRDRGWSSSADLAIWLLDTTHLAVVPGEAFNAPGCGANDCADLGAVSIPFLVSVAEQVLGARQIDRLHVVGHSMGGLTALVLADGAPARIASFTNIEGNVAPEDCFLS
ncbi:alpha/beta fold hydrolase [Streptomyces xantholiticus]|uniref:Alpha/beta fold hydrolase n=1 Tax=Streptomyces xantholiticus TaxID=68285 RepID=A0ABV1V433_9ACTN